MIACPCHEISRLFINIVRGDCGHLKPRWDNHHNCLKCSSCSRLSTCSSCCTRSEETWILADNRRKYAARKSVMTRKRQNIKKRLAVTSDLSDDNTIDGSTTPQAYTARGRTHQGGFYSDAKCIQSVSLPVTTHRITAHWSTTHQSTSHWSASHRSTKHQSTRQQSTVSQSPFNGHQSIHQAPVITHQTTNNDYPLANKTHGSSEHL